MHPRRWWISPVLTAVLSSALAIVVNLATSSSSAWLWVGVLALTALAAGMSLLEQRGRRVTEPDLPEVAGTWNRSLEEMNEFLSRIFYKNSEIIYIAQI